MSLFGILNMSSQTLLENQKGINIRNKNITNLNTDGYSKVDIEFADMVGGGAYIASAKRVYNNFLFNRLINTNQDLSYKKTLDTGLYQVESLFNDINGSGLASAIDNYYNSLNDVITNPDDIAARNSFLNSAKVLVGKTRTTSNSLEDILKNNKKYMEDSSIKINDLLKKLSEINKNILTFQNNEVKLNEYLDERDRSLKELSNFLEINVRYNDNNTVDIFSSKGHMLLLYDKYEKVLTKTENLLLTNSFSLSPATTIINPTDKITDSGTITLNYKKGDKDFSLSIDYTNKSLLDLAEEINQNEDLKATIINVGNSNSDYRLIVSTDFNGIDGSYITSISDSDGNDATGFNISNSNEIYNKKIEVGNFFVGSANVTKIINKGSIGALIKNNETVLKTMYNLDKFIQEFSYQNNSIHKLGYNLLNEKGVDLFVNEFNNDIYSVDSSNIKLNFEDPKKLSASLTQNNNADNEIAKALQNTKDKYISYIDNGEIKTFSQTKYLKDMSFSEFYRTEIVSPIAFESNYNKNRLKDLEFLTNTIEDKISEISGVNLDEELIKLNQLQRSYEANARVLNITDKLLETVLNLVK